MPQSLAKILVHVIFSTKHRKDTIPAQTRPLLHAYISGILKNVRSPSISTGGTGDHIHALLSLARTSTIADVVEEIKKSSSKWMKERGIEDFYWQAGYGAFSVRESKAIAVSRYIARQEEHHRRVSFQDELRHFLDRHRVAYDEQYVWD